MADRELLELAAKACGYDTSHPWNAERLTLTPPVNALVISNGSTGWDPLEDDGDALRLAVSLRLQVTPDTYDKKEVGVFRAGAAECYEAVTPHQSRREATRRAIVRAAAAIGKVML